MTPLEIIFVGLLLENITYGVYCVIFCLYLRIQHKRIGQSKNILFYALTANFILCTAYLAADNTHGQLLLRSSLEPGSPSLWAAINYSAVAVDALYICIDFISQGILIYRCWIMWHKLSVIAIPIILSIAFLATALVALVSLIEAPGYGSPEGIYILDWFYSLVTAFFSLSLAVNALATGLIVYKILTVYRAVQGFNKSHSTYLYGKESQVIYPVVSILVESGMITFVMQVVQAILYKVDANAFPIIGGLVVIFYGISTTIVLVRVDMGINYDNETSRTAYSNPHALRFAPFDSNNNQTVRTLDVIEHDSRQGSEMTKIQHV